MRCQISYLGRAAVLMPLVVAGISIQQWLLVLVRCVCLLPFVAPHWGLPLQCWNTRTLLRVLAPAGKEMLMWELSQPWTWQACSWFLGSLLHCRKDVRPLGSMSCPKTSAVFTVGGTGILPDWKREAKGLCCLVTCRLTTTERSPRERQETIYLHHSSVFGLAFALPICVIHLLCFSSVKQCCSSSVCFLPHHARFRGCLLVVVRI